MTEKNVAMMDIVMIVHTTRKKVKRMRFIIDIPEAPKNDHQRWVMANGEKYEPKQGEWLPVDIEEWVYRCSLCHDVSTFESKFCGNCGAYMKEGEEE